VWSSGKKVRGRTFLREQVLSIAQDALAVEVDGKKSVTRWFEVNLLCFLAS